VEWLLLPDHSPAAVRMVIRTEQRG
jgi:hypothetical protein